MKTHFHIRCADNQKANSSCIFASSKVGSGRTLCGFGAVLQWSYSRFIQWMSSVWDPSRDWGFGAFRFDLSVRKLWLPGTVPSTLLQHRGRRCHVSKELKRYAKDKIIEKLEGFFPFVQTIHCLNGSQITMSFMSNIHAGPKTALTLLLMRSYLLDTEIRIWPGQCETLIVFQVSVFRHQYETTSLPVMLKPWKTLPSNNRTCWAFSSGSFTRYFCQWFMMYIHNMYIVQSLMNLYEVPFSVSQANTSSKHSAAVYQAEKQTSNDPRFR